MNNLNFLPFNIFEDTYLIPHSGYLERLSNKIPRYLSKPKIKAPNSDIKAVRSGIRSAIYLYNEKYYRLKGCGWEDKGFIYEEIEIYHNESNIEKIKRLRGCQFLDTCMKELKVSEKLGIEFKKKNRFFPNFPLGMWIYETNHDETPCAGLFETFGEIRLNDGLLYILESKLNKKQTNFRELKELYFQIGQHIGNIKTLMNDSEYLWGTYFGKDGIFHSNAHINNIIVAKYKNKMVLGPLDFDLAYEPGELTNRKFEHKITDENSVLEASIKGWKVFTPELKLYNYENKENESLRNKLRNYMFEGFLSGLDDISTPIKFDSITEFF
jgi:hypothetical protein